MTNKVNLTFQSKHSAPSHQYEGTQAAIEALTVTKGAIAYATDINAFGQYNGTKWYWLGVPYERHIQIPAVPSGTPAASMDVDTLGTAVGLRASSSVDQYAGCQWEVPEDWDGADCYIEIDWLPFSGAMSGTDTIQWIIEYRAIAEGEVITAGTVATLTSTNADDLSQGQTKHSRMTITYNNANQPLAKQDHIYFLVHRNTAVANDFAGTALITAYEIIYYSNGLPTSN